MAENYIVVPLDAETARNLDYFGVPHPPPAAAPRGPRPGEVVAALSEFANLEQRVYSEVERQRIIIQVSDRNLIGRRTEVQMFGATADEAPCDLSFRGGSFLLVRQITVAVARRCGPLVIYPASGSDPVVCTGQSDTQEAADAPDPLLEFEPNS
jgi:hypothetical protein